MTRRFAFIDLDDTIYDRTRLRPEVSLAEGEGHPLAALDAEELREAIRGVQELSGVLGHFGLPDVEHTVEEPTLYAVAAALFTRDEGILREYGISAAWQGSTREELVAAQTMRSRASPAESLRAEVVLDCLRECRPGLRRLVDLVQALRSDERVVAMASSMPTESWEPLDGFARAWSLLERQASVYVVTHGVDRVQREKLSRLGLDALRLEMISTERAGNPLDAPAFRAAMREGVAEWARSLSALRAGLGASPPDRWAAAVASDLLEGGPGDLLLAYPLVWLLDRFASKTPEFYSRVLHAVHSGSESTVQALDRVEVQEDPEAWHERPLEFVIIGDRYDSDVEPVQSLLGSAVGVTVLLDRGMHANQRGASLPGNAPSHRVTRWSEVADLIARPGLWTAGRAVAAWPPLDPLRAVPEATLGWGRLSSFEVARRLAAALAREVHAP